MASRFPNGGRCLSHFVLWLNCEAMMNDFFTGRRDWLKRAATMVATGLVATQIESSPAAGSTANHEPVLLVADPLKTLV